MRKKRVVLGGIVGVIGLCVIAAAIMYSKLNQPASASLHATAQASDHITYDINLKPKQQIGSYISFDYPTGLNATPTQLSGPIVEDFNYTARDITSWLLAVEVSKEATDQLSSNSSYVIRKDNPRQYLESHEIINGQPVVIMSDQTASGFSKVAFVQHGRLLATISLLGNDTRGTAPLETSFTMVLQSLQWK